MSLNNAQIFSEDNILLMSLHIISELHYHLHFISFTKVNILKIIFHILYEYLLTSHFTKPEELKITIFEIRPVQSGVKHNS